MLDYVEQLFARYRRSGLLIDTNLLVLYLVGLLDPSRITSFKRTNAYTTDDFELLAHIVEHFETVVTTPHVLTEVSNLTGQLPQHLRRRCFTVFRQLIPALAEKPLQATVVADHPAFQPFGLTDAGIAETAPESHLVLTDDLPLYHFLAETGVDAINFNNLRPLNW